MNNKKVAKLIRNIIGEKYYFSKDCLIDSLVRLENCYNCKECALLDTIDTVRIVCPLIMTRETRMLK